MTFEAKPTSKLKLTVYVLISVVLAYLLASLAINSGSLVAYSLAFIAVYYGIYYLIRLFRVNKILSKEEKNKK